MFFYSPKTDIYTVFKMEMLQRCGENQIGHLIVHFEFSREDLVNDKKQVVNFK